MMPFIRAKECYEAALKRIRKGLPISLSLPQSRVGVGERGEASRFLAFMTGSGRVTKAEVLRKLGNALNELGNLQTRALTDALPDAALGAAAVADLAASALGFFQDGIAHFKEV